MPLGTAASRLPSLTGLRAVAALAVFVCHIGVVHYLADPAGDVFASLTAAGDTGVSLFFVLSGFVLAWSDRPEVGAIAFWRRRVARVWPLHVVVVAGALLVAALLVPGIRSPSPAAVLANLLLVNGWRADWWQAGNPVSWSLVCEAFFYLTFPLLFAAVSRLRGRQLALAGVVCLQLVVLAPLVPFVTPWGLSAFSNPLLRFPEFAAGVLLAVTMRQGVWRGPRVRTAVAVTALGYVAATVWSGTFWSFAGYTLPGYLLLVAALARADAEGRMTRLATPTMVRLGAWSFAFYLVHLLVIDALAGGGHPQLPLVPAVLLAIAALVVSTGLAATLHRWVEVPAQRWVLGTRLPERWRAALLQGR